MWESPKLKKHPHESGEQKNARAAEEYWSEGIHANWSWGEEQRPDAKGLYSYSKESVF